MECKNNLNNVFSVLKLPAPIGKEITILQILRACMHRFPERVYTGSQSLYAQILRACMHRFPELACMHRFPEPVHTDFQLVPS